MDEGMIYFDARLGVGYPTVEIRVMDVVPTAQDAVVLAALCRGLVDTAVEDWRRSEPPPDLPLSFVRAATWRAARFGLTGELVDPRAGLSLVWGAVNAGVARNTIPREGVLTGTLRVLDKVAWLEAPELIERLVHGLVAPYGAHATVTYERGVPPVFNDPAATALLTAAVVATLGPAAAVPTLQSFGGEDFAYYLDHVPGAMARLGVRPPGTERPMDLHQPTFDVDEAAIAVGVRVLAVAAQAALDIV